MAGIAVRPNASEYHEITSLSIDDHGWEVVTKEGKKFHFDGRPIWAEHLDKADTLLVDVKRGFVLIPPLQPIPHKIYDPGERSADKGREVIESP